MTCDLFNNNTGNYVVPGASPCAGDSGINKVEFIDKGIGIISGSEILNKMDFSKFSIPTTSWNQQTQKIGAGEVIFVQGLTKGLATRTQGFTIPNLNSLNPDLDSYYLDVDLSINYYSGFSFTYAQIDGSGNYSQNIDLPTSLDITFGAKNILTSSSYDPSSLTFSGTQLGYDFKITNVVLNVIDASQDSNSPFPPYIVNGQRVQQSYVLVENEALNVPFAKYPNSASQGVFLKPTYPVEGPSGTICPADKWILVNHATSPVTIYEPITLTFNSDVSCLLTIAYDANAILGTKPIIVDDVSILDVSSNYDVSISSFTIIDGSITLGPNIVIDGSSVISNVTILDSSVLNSVFNDILAPNSMYYGAMMNSSTGGVNDNNYFSNVNIYDSYLQSFNAKNSTIFDSILAGKLEDSTVINSTSVSDTTFLRTDVSGGTLDGSTFKFLGDPSSYNTVYNVGFNPPSFGAEFQYYDVSSLNFNTVTNLYLTGQDSKFTNIQASNKTINLADSSIYSSTAGINGYNVYIEDCSIFEPILNNSYITKAILGSNSNSSVKDSQIHNSLIYQNLPIQDSSIFNSAGIVQIDMVSVEDSSLYNSVIINSELVLSKIWDSSIDGGTFNQDTSVSNSSIINSWSNVYVLITNASTGEKLYVMDDDTLPLDSSAWRVNINTSIIWDSSFNNTTISDSSLYNCYLMDSSLIGCTTYNCIFDQSVEYDTRTIMVDASISVDSSISFDTSIYYSKSLKALDVGLSGCSIDGVISAGDYLNWVNDNNLWNKVGDLYAWTTAPDMSQYKNLLDGFYIYNPHTFSVSVQYMVFV
jgi:hypothetical protein